MKKCALLLAMVLLAAATVFAQKSTEVRPLESFNSVSVAGSFSKIVLKSGSKESVELLGDGGDLSKVITEVKGNNLQIHMKKGASSYNDGNKITLVVTYNSLKEVNSSGTTDIVVEGTLKADKFEFNTSGSGDLTGSFDVGNLELNIAGSADAKLSGKANEQHYAISGSGNVDAAELKGQTADVAISGSGDVSLNVDGKVKSSVAGSGDVTNKRN